MPRRITKNILELRLRSVSPYGEETDENVFSGDTIRYRISLGGLVRKGAALTIRNRLDKNLAHIRVFNKGQYDRASHSITWNIQGPVGKKGIAVEFETVIQAPGRVLNRAFIEGTKLEKTPSNTVTITAAARPKAGWIPLLPDAKTGEPPRVYMKDETTTGITVRVDIPGIFVREVHRDGRTMQYITLPGRGSPAGAGKPGLPVVRELIEIPQGVSFSPEVVETENSILAGYFIPPAQPLQPISDTRTMPLAFDKTVYHMDAEYPLTPAVANEGDIGVIRGHR
ncbi:MAG: C25 family peptidase propeptide domain-containing protein, partial [Methanoregula sp.]